MKSSEWDTNKVFRVTTETSQVPLRLEGVLWGEPVPVMSKGKCVHLYWPRNMRLF